MNLHLSEKLRNENVRFFVLKNVRYSKEINTDMHYFY